MKYDFQTRLDRSKDGSLKWKLMRELNPQVSAGIIPFSVADMEFNNPPEIKEGLKEFIDGAVMGYTGPTDAYFDAVCNWMEKRHKWHIKPEYIILSDGVVPALSEIVSKLTKPQDGVIVMPPVYPHFYEAIEDNGRKIVKNPLIRKDDTYVIDYEDLRKKAEDKNNTMIILCSPHNPVGRVWTKEELLKISDICIKNNVLIVSDEIHNDLILQGYEHTVIASLSEEIAENSVICTAPSKTFNLAGLKTSNIIVKNKELRDKLNENTFRALNIFGYKACEIAYNCCEQWLNELLQVIDNNRKMVEDFIKENIPSIKVIKMEGTYLQWLDLSALNMTAEELNKFLIHDAQLFVNDGESFGDGGKGFIRLNIACPTSVLKEAMERLLKALNNR